jgi:VWFA-related protein
MPMLPTRRILAVALALAMPAGAAPQAPGERQPTLVVPVGVEIVQVDCVVTDRDGRHVTDLRAGDFEVVEDGKTRAIANFRYVRTGRPEAPSAPAPSAQAPAAAPAAAPAMRPPSAESSTMAIVVDDLSLTFEGHVEARAALHRLVDERLAPGELVAILSTGGGSGNLQQFTTDKQLLKAAIAAVPFTRAGRGPVTAVARDPGPAAMQGVVTLGGPPSDAVVRATLDRLVTGGDRARQVNLALGTLSALEAVVQALSRMPGRKAMLFVSEGFVMKDETGYGEQVLARVYDVIDTANRASVVIYWLDPGGLRTYRPSASEILRAPADVEGYVPNATDAGLELAQGGVSLAVNTGGLALRDTNDLDAAVGRVLDDQRGYYLLGFEPTDGTSDRRRHKVSLNVKRPGLRVRSRSTFYPRAAPARDESKLITTLISPFAATDVPVRLTALFHHEPSKGSFVRTLLYIDARQLTFKEDPDGALVTEVEAAALSFGAEGRFAGQAGGTYTLRMSSEAAAAALDRGLVLALDIPAEPGPHQIRSAVRDVATGRAGSAFQFTQVPDVSKGGIALSGIVMSGTDAPAPTVAAGSVLEADATPAVRRFSAGDQVAYAFAVYNASRERAAGAPGLDVQVGLARDGVTLEVVPGPAVAVPAAGPVPVAGALRLAPELPPGTYTLRVLVRDPSRPTEERDAVQQIDFEIAPPAGP